MSKNCRFAPITIAVVEIAKAIVKYLAAKGCSLLDEEVAFTINFLPGTVQPTAGTVFRYVSEDDQYIFNLKTLKTQTDTYYIVAWFAEGYFEYIQVNLK